MTKKQISHEQDSISSEQIHKRLQSAIKNGSVGFITELLAIEHELPYQDKGFIDSVSKFLNNQKLDLLHIATDAIVSGQNVFRITNTLIQVFPQLKQVEPSSLLEFLKIYDEKTKNDLMSGELFEPIRERTASNKEWALKIESIILKNEDRQFYSHLLSIYLGFSDSDYDFGYNKIKAAYSSTDLELRAVGLRGLGLLSYLSDKVKEKSFSVILLGVDDKNEVIAFNAAFSLSRWYTESAKLGKKRIELSKNSTPAVHFEILRQIQFKQGKLDPDDFKVIKNLCAYDLSLKGITKALDDIIYFLVSKNRTKEVKDILTTWVSSHTFEDHKQYNFTKQFEFSIFEIKNNELIETIITEWFNSDDSRFHHVLQDIISYMGAHGIKTVEFNLEIIKSFNDKDFLYVVRKILGFTHDFNISISLLLSILKLEPLSNKTAALVSSVLIEHIGENYLVKTIDRLSLEIKTASKETEKFKALNTALYELQKRKNQRSALSNRNELMPNANHQAKLNKAFHENTKALMKEAQKESVIQSLVPQVLIKSGLSTFSFINGGYQEPSKMVSLSHGIELPKKDVLDEVGASIERSGFRLVRRGEP